MSDLKDLFEGFEEDLELEDSEREVDLKEPQKEIEDIEDVGMELTADETMDIEAAAVVGQADSIDEIDAFIDQYKEETKKDIKKKSAKTTLTESTKEVEPKQAKPKKEPYKGPRKIVAYGTELWIENDPTVTEEQIRMKLVEDYLYPEFAKDRTTFSLDETTGIMVPGIKFEKRG